MFSNSLWRFFFLHYRLQTTMSDRVVIKQLEEKKIKKGGEEINRETMGFPKLFWRSIQLTKK